MSKIEQLYKNDIGKTAISPIIDNEESFQGEIINPNSLTYLNKAMLALGKSFTSFKIKQGETHSSYLDRVVVDIKKGDRVTIYVNVTQKQDPYVTYQVFGIYPESDEMIVSANIYNNNYNVVEFTAARDYEKIGIYVGNVITDDIFSFLVVNNNNNNNLVLNNRLANEIYLNLGLDFIEFYILKDGYHSSTLDRFNTLLIPDEEYTVIIKTDPIDESFDNIQATVYSESDVNYGTQTFSRGFLAIKFTSKAKEKIGIYIDKIDKNVKFKSYLIKSNPNILGYSTFNVTTGNIHSSTLDRINYICTPGVKYRLDVTCNQNDTQIQVFGLNDLLIGAATITGKKATFNFEVSFATPVGLYTGPNENDATYTLKLYKVSDNVNDEVTIADSYYSTLLNSEEFDTFIYFTDPHWYSPDSKIPFIDSNYDIIKNYYDNTPVDFVMCGGDWLTHHTKMNAIKFLSDINCNMRKICGDKFKPVLGNHDTNYQGETNTGTLEQGTINNILFQQEGKAYYNFKTTNTRYYVFDTGTDWDGNIDAYRQEQIDWFKSELEKNKLIDKHIIISAHILTNQELSDINKSGLQAHGLMVKIFDVINEYNARSGSFYGAIGNVFAGFFGHSHFNLNTIYKNIPCVIVSNSPNAELNLVTVDYTKKKIYLTGIGHPKTEVDI